VRFGRSSRRSQTAAPAEQGAYLFPTRTGGRQHETKVRVGTLGGP
jgi:hypothetical protein